MKKYFLVLLFLVVATGLLWGYIESFKDHIATLNDSAEEVKVGLNLELTGPYDYYGNAIKNGTLLAFEEINQAGGVNGIKIVPFIVDNKSDPVRSAFLANELAKEGVVSIIGPDTSDNFLKTIPTAMQYKIPNISATASADDITVNKNGKVYDYVFRITFNDTAQSAQMAKFALNNLQAKNAIVIREGNSAYSNGLAENFIKVFKGGGGNIVDLMNYTSNEMDFKPYLNRIQREDFDVIYLPAYDVEAAHFIKQAREVGITQPILGGDYNALKLLEIVEPSSLNNVYYVTDYLISNPDPKVQNFVASYKEKYGTIPSFDSVHGYDSAYFIADAIQRAGSTNPQAIRDAMASTENFRGVSGTFSMDKEHNPIKSLYIVELENGIPLKSIMMEPTK